MRRSKVKLDLTKVDGNAFCLMGAFACAAEREGWSKADIKVVLDKCMSGDYDNLVTTLDSVCMA